MKWTGRQAAILLAGAAVLLTGGTIYAWSVLSAPIRVEYPDWSESTLSLAYTVSILAFGIGQLTGGALVKRTSAKVTLIFAGILFLLGFGFASRAVALWAIKGHGQRNPSDVFWTVQHGHG